MYIHGEYRILIDESMDISMDKYHGYEGICVDKSLKDILSHPNL
jgi:hypothetical protein